MIYYLCFALGFYIGALLVNPMSFKNVPWTSIYLGILGAIIWPVTIILMLIGGDYPPFKER